MADQTCSTPADLEMHRDLEELHDVLLDGAFYQDYDESSRLMGRLREHLDALAAGEVTDDTERRLPTDGS